MNTKHFYQDKSIFGFDIGFNTIKVMQLSRNGNRSEVTCFGLMNFKPEAIENGVIVDPEEVARATGELFHKYLIGDITTRRVAFSVPAARTFSRVLTLPKLAQKDLDEAVKLEAEQYIPVPIGELYLDHTVIGSDDKNMEVLAVAIPKKIVDSYATLGKLLNLEVVVMETTTGAMVRLFRHTDQSNLPTVLIDFGSVSADITIFDHSLVVTGTVAGGGDDLTKLIGKDLQVSKEEAHVIKTKYGLSVSKKQNDIKRALEPVLSQHVKEIKRMIRYYEERSKAHKKIEQVVILGGGSNMPGLSEYLTDTIRLPVRPCNPWSNISFGKLKQPSTSELSIYITVAGLALIDPREIFV